MKIVVAATAGLVLALVPGGTAFAGEGPQGKSYGNCQSSSAGGVHAPSGEAGNGNGGQAKIAKALECVAGPEKEIEAPDGGPQLPVKVGFDT